MTGQARNRENGQPVETAWGIGQRFPSDEVPSPKVMVTPINHGVASV